MHCSRKFYNAVNALRTQQMCPNSVNLGNMLTRRFLRSYEPFIGGRRTTSSSIFQHCSKYIPYLQKSKCHCTPNHPSLLFPPCFPTLCSGISISKRLYSSKKVEDSRVPKKYYKLEQDKDSEDPTITLLGADNSFYGHKPKSEALLLAKKQGLLLTHVSDANIAVGKRYPMYKLMSAAQLQKEEMKQNQSKGKSKTMKKLHLSHKIDSHDLSVKINTMKKWLGKNHEIHVMVTSGGDSDAPKLENIYQEIEKGIKSANGKLLQKSVKNNVLKFTITAMPQKN